MTQPAFPSESTTLLLDGPAGALEVAIDLPEPADARPLLAVVCHPLPTEGGTMHNKVVTMVARALRELGATTVRFNFRGTGGSAGAFDHGKGEREDLRAVVEWARAGHPGHALWLAGFSFGAYVSLSAAAALRPDALISIAPPVAGRGWEFYNGYNVAFAPAKMSPAELLDAHRALWREAFSVTYSLKRVVRAMFRLRLGAFLMCAMMNLFYCLKALRGNAPACFDGVRRYDEFRDLPVDDYSRTMMDKTLAELEEERAGVAHLL